MRETVAQVPRPVRPTGSEANRLIERRNFLIERLIQSCAVRTATPPRPEVYGSHSRGRSRKEDALRTSRLGSSNVGARFHAGCFVLLFLVLVMAFTDPGLAFAGLPKNVIPEIEGKPGRNGLIVYVQVNRNRPGSSAYMGASGIYSFNPRTRKHSRLVKSNHAAHPRFTVDGRKSVFVDEVKRERSLFSMNPDGSGKTLVASDVGEGYPDFALIPGNRIWFQNTSGEAATVNLDGSGYKNLGKIKGEITFGSATANGGKVVYQFTSGRYDSDVFVYNKASDKRTRFKKTSWAVSPHISPDGHWITFLSGDWNNVWVTRTNGKARDLIAYVTGTLGLGDPMFSPDGKRLLVMTYYGGIATYLTHFQIENLGRNGPFLNIEREGPVYISDADWQSR